MNIEEKLVSREVEVQLDMGPDQVNVLIDGEPVLGLTYVGISCAIRDSSPVLVLVFGDKGTEIPIRGVFRGKGLGGET